MSSVFQVYTSPDILGIELYGALKMSLPLAAGVSDGLGCGDNTKGSSYDKRNRRDHKTWCCNGWKAETFSGLSGIGDLICHMHKHAQQKQKSRHP